MTHTNTSELDSLVDAFVRKREEMSDSDLEKIKSPETIQEALLLLNNLKRDVESQFTYQKLKFSTFKLAVLEAQNISEESGEDPIVTFYTRSGQKYTVSPAEAEMRFEEDERRWRVKNVKFSSLIERSIQELKLHMNTQRDGTMESAIALSESVNNHRDSMTDAVPEDAEIYQANETFRAMAHLD